MQLEQFVSKLVKVLSKILQIVERAIKRKPLAEKIEIKTEESKSILFPEESYKDFEKEYFCS